MYRRRMIGGGGVHRVEVEQGVLHGLAVRRCPLQAVLLEVSPQQVPLFPEAHVWQGSPLLFALRRGEHPAYIFHAGYDVGGAACSVDGCQRVALDGTQFAHQWALDLEAEEPPFVAAYDVRDAFLLVRSGGVLPPKAAHLFAEVREDLFLDFRLRGYQPAGQLPGLGNVVAAPASTKA